jgi:ATP-dependent Clp protease ATP-binding subunit ClpB
MPGVILDPERAGHEAEALLNGLRRLVVGQDEAIEEIVGVYQLHVAGIGAAGRPIGNFLFLGPTGSGKTRMVEALAETLVGDARAVVKIDCAEFQHSHEIAKLIGSPPGYLGHRETAAALSQEALNRYHTEAVKISLVLFDEIEKASDALWNLLLGVLDKATLTLGDNRRVDFSQAMIFMTSNLGAAQMKALVEPGIGFSPAAADARTPDRMTKAGLEAARRKFTPEFMNRLDKVVTFKPLGEPELRRVLDIELRAVQQRVFADCANPFGFALTEAAKSHVLSEGVDPRYGARLLKRAIERLLVQPMSNLVASRQVSIGDWISVDYDPCAGRMVFVKEERAEGGQVHPMVAANLSVSRRLAGGSSAQEACPALAQSLPLGEVSFGE